jgi:ribose-phosphate pyrophosphokinase
MIAETPSVFALNSSRDFAERVAQQLGIILAPHEEREFEDGEHKARPLESVRGKDVFVIQSLYGDARQSVNDKLCRLLFFIGALVDAAAGSVTAVIPYFCYARKDRKSQPRDPVTTRYVARLFEAVGSRRVVTLDVHNLAAFQNAFRCQTENLEANNLFVDYFAARLPREEIVVVSPDTGGVGRAEHFRQTLGRALGRPIGSAFMEKQRAGGVVSGAALIGDVAGKVAVIIDDLISTGTTLARAAEACRARGATKVFAAASHGLFVRDAATVLKQSAIDKVVVTDTVPPFRLPPEIVRSKLVVASVAPLFAEAIKRMHAGGSLVDLLTYTSTVSSISDKQAFAGE